MALVLIVFGVGFCGFVVIWYITQTVFLIDRRRPFERFE
jgi:hypothetical protein